MAALLKLFGGISISTDEGPVAGRAVHRHRLALLALLGAGRPVPRDKILALLWPERDAVRARALLNQAVHALRGAIGTEAIRSSAEELRLDTTRVASDLMAFEAAVAAGALEEATAQYGGPFLDGFFLRDAPDFERWAETERQRLTTTYGRVLEALADRAEAAGDEARATEWLRRRAAHDPLDSRAILRFVRALDASGHRAAAIRQADAHQRLLRDEIGIEPSAEFLAFVARLRTAPSARAALVPGTPREAAPEAQPDPPNAAPPATAAGTAGSTTTPAARGMPRRLAVPIGVLAALLIVGRVALPRVAGRADAGTLPAGTVEEIARAVSRELARRERGDADRRTAAQRTTSIAAYESYLRGSDPANLRSDSAAYVAVAHFQRAVALDSTYAAAWAGLARLTLRTRARARPEETARITQEAEAAARRALAIDDSLAEAHATMGLVRMGLHDNVGAEVELRRAIALDPTVAVYREWLLMLRIWSGDAEEALAESRRALALQPMSPTANAEYARALIANDRSQEALVQLQKLTDLQPPLARVAGLVALGHAQQGHWAQAIAAIRPQADAGIVSSMGLLAYLLARAGEAEPARALLARLMERQPREAGAMTALGVAHIGLDEWDLALPWLERAADHHVLSAVTDQAQLVRWLLSPRRDDPRVARLWSRLGLGAP